MTSDVMTDREIDFAELHVRSYQRLMPRLYGESEETYTCHALMNLPDQVRKHGPLILHFGFVFEAMMSHLKQQFRGIHRIIDQIVRNLLFAQNSGTLIKRESREPQEVRSFINERSISSGGKLLLHAAIHNRP